MQLVTKKAPRGRVMSTLTTAEVNALGAVFGLDRENNQAELQLAEEVLKKMSDRALWLKCDCLAAGEEQPLNTVRMRDGTLTLVNFSGQHHTACPLHRPRRVGGGNDQGDVNRHPSAKRIDFHSFLPREERGARIRAPKNGINTHNVGRRRRRIPAIARLLLTLIENAKLNLIDPVFPLQVRKKTEVLEAVKAATEKEEFAPGWPLSEIVFFKPWLNAKQQEECMHRLEEDQRPWPAGRAHTFYQILFSEEVSQDEVIYKNQYKTITFRPERRVSINGEVDGQRGNYWVILMFQRNHDGGVVCRDAYAHALHSYAHPVPVDSQLERNTIASITRAGKWLHNRGYSIELIKPLFDVEVMIEEEKMYVLPDFMLNILGPEPGEDHQYERRRQWTIIVETMGYTDDEYVERKAQQHVGMAELGLLLKDPPRWPTEAVGEDDFVKHLFGHIVNLN